MEIELQTVLALMEKTAKGYEFIRDNQQKEYIVRLHRSLFSLLQLLIILLSGPLKLGQNAKETGMSTLQGVFSMIDFCRRSHYNVDRFARYIYRERKTRCHLRQRQKNELARIEPEKKCCQLAEIAGFLRVSGSLRLAGGGKFKIVITTENPAVARHYKKS